MNDELVLTKADDRYADEIASYRQDFLESGNHMDSSFCVSENRTVVWSG